MNNRVLGLGLSSVLLSCVVLVGCSKPAAEVASAAAANNGASQGKLVSGLEIRYFDTSVRPQDDLYRYINGKWLDTVQIPADKARYGTFYELAESAEVQLHAIVDGLKDQGPAPNSDAQKIRDLYASFMDEARLESLGLKPLQAELDAIDQLKSVDALSVHMAHLVQVGVNVPLVPYIHQDNRDSTHYAVDLYQAGLGLPDRDYYLMDGEKGGYKTVRATYREHIARMLTLAGQADAAMQAPKILQLETALAKVQWDKVVNRDPVKTYNKYPLDKLKQLAPTFAWVDFMQAAGVTNKVDYLLVSQPSYVTAFSRLLRSEPLSIWKSYLKWRLVSDFAPYLSKPFVDANFAFNGTTLSGIPENRPRWKRGLSLIESSIGEGLGKLYVAKHFPPENKQRMEALIGNLLLALRYLCP